MGGRVFLPRPAGRLARELAERGLDVTDCPVQRRHVLIDSPEGLARLREVAAEWSVVTSARTVETLRELGVRLPGRIATVGRASAEALRAAGYDVELVPHIESTRGLLAEFPPGPGDHEREMPGPGGGGGPGLGDANGGPGPDSTVVAGGGRHPSDGRTDAPGLDAASIAGRPGARGWPAHDARREQLEGAADMDVVVRDAGVGIHRAGRGRVFLPCSALAQPALAEGLRALGWQVEVRHVYTMVPADIPEQVAQRWRAGRFAAVVVTSGSVARAIDAKLGWPEATRVLAIGQPTAEVLAQLGVAASVSPSPGAADIATAVAELVGKGNV
ncbi:MAG: uroporphyrinogen-III synthase [Actinomycetaceae bacterium]|nr:uroporphyrinogen-III synthase [Actinomycetaceae bacterium]